MYLYKYETSKDEEGYLISLGFGVKILEHINKINIFDVWESLDDDLKWKKKTSKVVHFIF